MLIVLISIYRCICVQEFIKIAQLNHFLFFFIMKYSVIIA